MGLTETASGSGLLSLAQPAVHDAESTLLGLYRFPPRYVRMYPPPSAWQRGDRRNNTSQKMPEAISWPSQTPTERRVLQLLDTPQPR